jgi:hypothetical protein
VDHDGAPYRDMARRLAASLREWHPEVKICLVTDQVDSDPVFDYQEPLPYGDQGAFANDWQVWSASPFRETVKLEADMLVTSAIDHWWTLFRHRDVVISTGCRDYLDRVSSSRHYRKIFDSNGLADVYNAVTYWRLSATAKEFWELVRAVFGDWDAFKTLIKFAPSEPDTDLVYAMVAEIMGPHRVTLPFATYPKITHMKQHIIGSSQPDWTTDMVWEYQQGRLRVNTVAQWGCFHYHHKHWNHER